jgi:hypothetical protein
MPKAMGRESARAWNMGLAAQRVRCSATGGDEARRRLVLRDGAGYSRALTDWQLDMGLGGPALGWRHSPTLLNALLRFAALVCMTAMQRLLSIDSSGRTHAESHQAVIRRSRTIETSRSLAEEQAAACGPS